MSPPRRAIISITSASATLHGDHLTGVFISEALHPFNAFKAAGFEVDIVSEKGTWTPDWLSLQPDFLPDEERQQYEDTNGEFRKKLDSGLRPDKVDASQYGIFFASAGHAALIDYPTAKGLQGIASTIYANGGIMSTVCHGPALFPGILDPETGESIIKGKTITGFTTEGENVMHIMETLRSWNAPMVDEHAANLGAKYTRPEGVWDSFDVVDGRVVTGTNPASATETANAVLKEFGKL
ncbi:plasma membrane heat shock protein [Vermiconidia calcicola]|uniref:Plasma membrane heat shock protein n=1 Tax=Vermiconidia calcicola TaxID=1690605 RepID=A0ACC3N6S5_9PEZI|nr:plasma membrane heat shock protein [Vermiconidia calcicola]